MSENLRVALIVVSASASVRRDSTKVYSEIVLSQSISVAGRRVLLSLEPPCRDITGARIALDRCQAKAPKKVIIFTDYTLCGSSTGADVISLARHSSKSLPKGNIFAVAISEREMFPAQGLLAPDFSLEGAVSQTLFETAIRHALTLNGSKAKRRRIL